MYLTTKSGRPWQQTLLSLNALRTKSASLLWPVKIRRAPEKIFMKALIYKEFGSVNVLDWVNEWPDPELTEESVLVTTVAGSINPKDVLLRKGKFSKTLARDSLPRVSGLDVAGRIASIGNKVNGFSVGDPVY